MTLTLEKEYWNLRWQNSDTPWDIGYPSPAITQYIDSITDREKAILIPGCGNAYEVEYLIDKGFLNITLIDISSSAVEKLQKKFQTNKSVKILCQDFFEHCGNYDLILEQTFFCAILPQKRKEYVMKMHQLLNEKGRLVGLLFNREFPLKTPPFGGSIDEYRNLFSPLFEIEKMENCTNSIPPRKNSEIFIDLRKK